MKLNWSPIQTRNALRSCSMLAFVVAACCASYAQQTRSTGTRKPTVLVLATSHMNNPGRDVLNAKWDDVLTGKREKEIREFVNLLKRFKPTKIAIEVPFGSVTLGEKYNSYLLGEYQLTRDEREQLGFRLAKELNHQKIYGVNAEGEFDIERVVTFAKANNQQEIVDKAFEIVKRQIEELNRLIQNQSIKEIHKFLNDPRQIKDGHQAYVKLAGVGKDDQYPGTDVTADWYKRNLKIFSNITRVTESKDDRILVIYGAGHAMLLQQFVEDSGEYYLERLGKYLD